MSSTTERAETVEFEFDEVFREMQTPEFLQNPYQLYERMRRETPVYRSSQGVWYLTRYADVDTAVFNPALSSDRERIIRAMEAQGEALARVGRLARRGGQTMLTADPPDHTRLRKLAVMAFTARRVRELRPRIEAITDELLDAAVAAGPTMDLIAALAFPLPITVISELLGVPHADRGHIRAWSRQLIDSIAMPDGLELAEQASQAFDDYMRDLIRRRRSEPGDDLISGLIAARERNDQLSEDELTAACVLLLVAGHETTVNLIGNGMLALFSHPDELRRLRDDPGLIRSAVEELLRYDSPAQAVQRVVVGEVEIGGVTLSDGERVLAMLGAANRDPDRFPEPDRLDVARADNRHLSFGNGPHFCLGAPLARLEGEIAIGALVRRLPGLRLDTDVIQWRPNPLLRGLATLPIAY
jgi:cytochrome P450